MNSFVFSPAFSSFKTPYIAGPMRGVAHYNFPLFFAVQWQLESRGMSPGNPALFDCDRVGGMDEMCPDEAGDYLMDNPKLFHLNEAITEDLTFIANRADCLVLLPGWLNSTGALLEVELALMLDLPLFSAVRGSDVAEWTYVYLPDHVAENLMSRTPEPEADKSSSGEVRTTSDTGAQKGVKPEDYSLIPWEAMDEVARVYDFGARKYDRSNWRAGYEWSKSFAACLRHLTLWDRGEDSDSESGLNHLAHAVFHMLALLTWSTEEDKSRFDDRYRSNQG